MGKNNNGAGLAEHHYLWPNLTSAVRGTVKPFPGYKRHGGTINYKGMDAAEQAIRAGNWDPLMEWLAAQREVGHLSLKGPNGAGTEAGAPGMHYAYNCTSVLGAWREAERVGHRAAINACIQWVGSETALAREFLDDTGSVFLPCGRVKDERQMVPQELLRDVLLAQVDGRPIPGPAAKPAGKWWQSDYALPAAILRQLLGGGGGEALRERLGASPPPRLLIPIYRVVGGDNSGCLAWLQDSTTARKAAIDPCNWIDSRGWSAPRFGFDWSTPPSAPEGAQVQCIGGAS